MSELEEFKKFIANNDLNRRAYRRFKPVIDDIIRQQDELKKTRAYAGMIKLGVYWGFFNGLSLITGGPILDYNTLINIEKIAGYCVDRYLINKQHGDYEPVEVTMIDELEVDFNMDTDLLEEVINNCLAVDGKLVVNLYDDDELLEKRLRKEKKCLPRNLVVEVYRLKDMTWDGVEELVLDYAEGMDFYSEVFDKEPVLARDGELIISYEGEINKHSMRQLKRLKDYFKVTLERKII
ncbi:hypothetical protein GF352_03405 [archaeon]|nr:hypothetical protein [archaeon]